MRVRDWIAAFGFATGVLGHGFVKSINIDGAIYPGFDPHRDARLGAKRVAFGFYAGLFNIDGTAAIMNVFDKGLACNSAPTPPEMMGTVRPGANISLHWTKWLPSHKGPMTTYLAPYTGNLSSVDVNKLQFFKIHESGLYPDGEWATDKLIASSGLWNVTLPHDIKPGTYVLRHELLSLHFATTDSNATYFGIVGPQFYVSCYNIQVTGNGTATPPGVTFPGGYRAMDPGLIFDIYLKNPNYPIPGPKVYTPSGLPPTLKANPPTLVSAMGDPAKDEEYYKEMEQELNFWQGVTDFFQSIGG